MLINHKFYKDKKDILDRGLEDKSELLEKTNYIVRDTTDLPIESTFRDGLFASKFLLLLREE